MSDSDDALLRRYRASASEEPGAALDAAIVAAARDAVQVKPFARRWAVPVYIAATLVLAFGVTLHFERERPDLAADARRSTTESASPPASSPSPEKPQPPAQSQVDQPVAPSRPAARESKAAAPVPPSAARAKVRSPAASEPSAGMRAQSPAVNDDIRAAPTTSANMQAVPSARVAPSLVASPQPAASPPPVAASGAPARALAPERSPDIAAEKRSAAASDALQKDTVESDPVRELERIATLRAAGRDEEADHALEAFRKAHPDYRIEPAMWDRVRSH
jgi:hypothetical protein